MADPKYADLPGIAYDQPDVYETNELPESDQNTDFYEEEADSIERLHISASEAFNKFKGKSLLAGGVDFSDSLDKIRRTGYDARSVDWELVGVGEKETPLQKLQRLQCEMKELMEEVSQLKNSEKSTADKQTITLLATEVEKAQKQLARVKLEEVLGSEIITNLTDPQGAQLKKVLSLIDGLKETSVGTPQKGSDKVTATGDKGVITYQLNYQPEHARLSQSARLAELEQKLHRLETVVGNTPNDKLARLSKGMQGKCLAEVAQTVLAKVTLFDSAQVEMMEGRMTALAQKMDTVVEKVASTCSPESSDTTRKVCEMYEVVKKTEDLSQVLPHVLDRMTALQSLHQQAVNIIKSLMQLEELQHQISAGLVNNEVLLKNVQQTFSTNLLTIQKNLSSLDARISAIKK